MLNNGKIGSTCKLVVVFVAQNLPLRSGKRKKKLLYRIVGKFGGELNLVFWQSIFAATKSKSACISYLHVYNIMNVRVYVYMAIPYRTAKFKSANIFAMAIWGPTAKFNSHQYFQLYGSIIELVDSISRDDPDTPYTIVHVHYM